MTKPNLTFAIIVSLGLVGCGGLGAQTTGSLTAAHDSARGVDSLWAAPTSDSTAGVTGTLVRADAGASRGDLWNPAPAQRAQSARTERRPSGGLYVSDASSGIAF